MDSLIVMPSSNANSIIRAFDNYHINIIKEEPNTYLFKASDISNILGITNIRSSIQNYDEDEKVIREIASLGNQKIIYLTSRGVYRILYNSKKEIAKKFRKWVGDILDDIIFNDCKQLKEMIKEQELIIEQHKNLIDYQANLIEEKDNIINEQNVKYANEQEKLLVEKFQEKQIMYIIYISNNLYKFGETRNIIKRLSEHKREIHKDVILIDCFETHDSTHLETLFKDFLKKHNKKLSRVINGKNQTELFETDEFLTLDFFKQMIILFNSNIKSSSEERILQLQLDIEKTKKENSIINTLPNLSKTIDIVQNYTENNNYHFSINLYSTFLKETCDFSPDYKQDIRELLIVFKDYLQGTIYQEKINSLYNPNNKLLKKSYYYDFSFKDEFYKNLENILHSKLSQWNKIQRDTNTKKWCIGLKGIKLKREYPNTIFFSLNIYSDFFNSVLEITDNNQDKVKLIDILQTFISYIKKCNIEIPNDIFSDKLKHINFGYNFLFKKEFEEHFNHWGNGKVVISKISLYPNGKRESVKGIKNLKITEK